MSTRAALDWVFGGGCFHQLQVIQFRSSGNQHGGHLGLGWKWKELRTYQELTQLLSLRSECDWTLIGMLRKNPRHMWDPRCGILEAEITTKYLTSAILVHTTTVESAHARILICCLLHHCLFLSLQNASCHTGSLHCLNCYMIPKWLKVQQHWIASQETAHFQSWNGRCSSSTTRVLT
jgi:hypothetical protein